MTRDELRKECETVGKYKGDTTVIVDGQGWKHDGIYCSNSYCPYLVYDENGDEACYYDMYLECIEK